MADGADHAAFSPYDSPFAAFTNYMNVLADFLVRVQEQFPENIDNEELNSLLLTIRNQAAEIESLKKENKSMRTNIENSDEKEVVIKEEIVEEPVKKTARKTTVKKSTAKKESSTKKPTRKTAKKD